MSRHKAMSLKLANKRSGWPACPIGVRQMHPKRNSPLPCNKTDVFHQDVLPVRLNTLLKLAQTSLARRVNDRYYLAAMHRLMHLLSITQRHMGA